MYLGYFVYPFSKRASVNGDLKVIQKTLAATI
jgi:hypothetical protein